ncbi:MAG: hypothetical protein ACJ73S_11780 [Mycobacteriales bacterium]
MYVATAGELVAVTSELRWATRLVDRAVGGALAPVPPPDDWTVSDSPDRPTVLLQVESERRAFDRFGLRPVTRGAYADEAGEHVLLEDCGGSGWDLLVAVGQALTVTARYRPGRQARLANRALRQRFALLTGQVLVHYPVLWRASWRARVPLHVSVLSGQSGTPMLAGPGGVGKSTVLRTALAAGAVATADNLCCTDGAVCYGLAEPLRTDATGGAGGAKGPATSHGRVEEPFASRVPALVPDRVVVLQRGPRTSVQRGTAELAAATLAGGTYAAGELRRYWQFAATLGLATGRVPAHPPVAEVADVYAQRLPCLRVRVGDGDVLPFGVLCGTEVAA